MRYPDECYQMSMTIAEHFPHLRPAQQRGLALWVYGTVLAKSACQNAVIAALLVIGTWDNLRQYLREWLYDGEDKAAPSRAEIDITLCFGPLIRWVLSWWQGREIALAIDATAHKDRLVALTVSVLYRGSAIPLAWHILPGGTKGAWMPHILRLLRTVHRHIPAEMHVLVMADRGLWSPRLRKRIRDLGWHPLLRLNNASLFQPVGAGRQPARRLVPGPGHAWVGRGTAFEARRKEPVGTLVVVWAEEEEAPWALLTDLAPEKVGIWWYGLRVWIELGFRALKGLGWRWEHTRRVDPTRVARHWLVLAVATIWVMAYGTRAEDAEMRGVRPAHLRTAPSPASREACPGAGRRKVSVFERGLSWMRDRLCKGRLWRRLWLAPEPWPDPPFALPIVYHASG